MDGNGSLFATLNGNHREILHKMSVELPKKHGRGGQSALRFARLRLEKRHNYVTKVRVLHVYVCVCVLCGWLFVYIYILVIWLWIKTASAKPVPLLIAAAAE